MKRNSIRFFQFIIVLIGVGALFFLLWEPQIEGRNTYATQFEIYFKDPFLAYVYFASIPFFILLFQAFKVLGGGGKSSQDAVNALRRIKYCAISMIGFVAIGEVFIMLNNSDDRAGGVFMGILVTLFSIVIAVTAEMFEKKYRK